MSQLIDRFNSKWEEQENGCWQWVAWKVGGGGGRYGALRTQTNHYEMAHRLSYMMFKGDIPEGLHVRHKCDNGLCVNPSHLELGTHTDNMQDMQKRGRANHVRKFSDEEIMFAVKMREMTFPVKDIAELLGMDRGHCSRITRKHA